MNPNMAHGGGWQPIMRPLEPSIVLSWVDPMEPACCTAMAAEGPIVPHQDAPPYLKAVSSGVNTAVRLPQYSGKEPPEP